MADSTFNGPRVSIRDLPRSTRLRVEVPEGVFLFVVRLPGRQEVELRGIPFRCTERAYIESVTAGEPFWIVLPGHEDTPIQTGRVSRIVILRRLK